MTNIINEIKHNIDNYERQGSHIRPTVQNIILNFGNPIIPYTNILQGQAIAQSASELDLKKLNKSQSWIWCPLIWKALYKSGYNIPIKWGHINFNNLSKIILFNDIVDKLVNLDGWSIYAFKVLKYKFENKQLKGNNNFDNNFVINISKKIKNT